MLEKSEAVIDSIAPAQMDTSILDRDAVLDRVGGDEDLLCEIIGIFFEEYPVLMAGIRGAVAQRNAANLERSAHSLKGSVANFGVRAPTEMAHDLELMGRQGELRGAAPLVSGLDRELAALHRALLSFQRSSRGA